MQFSKKLNKRVNIILTSVLLLSVILAAIYAVLSFSNVILNSSRETAEILADTYTRKIKAVTDKAVYITQITASSLITPQNKDDNTQQAVDINNTLMHTIRIEPNIASIYFIFEEKSESTKDTVQFLGLEDNNYIYWKRTKKGIRESVKDGLMKITDKEIAKIRRTRKIQISEPFFVRYAGEDEVAVSITMPVVLGNKFYGILTVNYMLSEIKHLINRPIGGLSQTNLMLLSEHKNILFISGKDWLSTKSITEYQGKERRLYDKMQFENNLTKDQGITFTKKNIYPVQGVNWEFFSFVPQKLLVENLLDNVIRIIGIAALIVILSLFIAMHLINNELKNMQNLKIFVNQIKNEEFPEIKQYKNKNEISEIGRLLKDHLLNLYELRTRLRKLNAGDLSENQENNTELNKLTDSLREKLEKEQLKYQTEKEGLNKQIWLRKGRFEVANAQRKNPHDIQELSNNLLKSVMDYTGAAIAGLYFYYDEDVEEPYLQIKSGFAYGDQKHPERKFALGEGLIGTCALERKTIRTAKLPENYLTIKTGLNAVPPTFLFIVPIVYQGTLIAVAEYVFLKQPEEYKLEFIEQLTETIGGWLDTAINSTRNKKLLEMAQQNATELSEKEAELNKQIVQMMTLEAENSERAAEMQSLLNALNHTVMRVEYKTDGTVLDANELYLNTMGFRLEDIKGQNIFELVKEQGEELKATVEEVKKGKSIEKRIVRKTASGEEKELFASYTPYYNSAGELERIIFFGFDISVLQEKS